MMKRFGVILRVFCIALVLMFSISGCQNAANSDRWTEFTPSTIKNQMVKYDGKYSKPMSAAYTVFDNAEKKIVFGTSEVNATEAKFDAEAFIVANNDLGSKWYGNGSNKIKIVTIEKVNKSTVSVHLNPVRELCADIA